jgi:DmsE family decaheme c-type cytochrome
MRDRNRDHGLPTRPVRRRSGRATAVMTGLLFVTAAAAAQQSGKPADNPYTAQYTGEGAAACLYCHDVERMRFITNTPHGNKKNPDSPFAQHACESCHGPGSLHATRSRRGHGRPPMINFDRNSTTPPARRSESCLNNCHEKKMGQLDGMQWKGSVHATPWKDAAGKEQQMSCTTCHKIHVEHDPMKDKQAQAKVCYSCHQKAQKEHPRFEDKAIAFDKLSCWDCHDVHQLIPAGR